MKFYCPFLVSALCAGGATSETAKFGEGFFAKSDKNSDNSVDADEFFRGLWREQAIDLSKFKAADGDKDGKLSGDELNTAESAATPGEPERSFRKYFQIAKTTKDKDGHSLTPAIQEASIEDYKDAVIHMWTRDAHKDFTTADVDKNDKLDAKEFQSAFEKRLTTAKLRLHYKYQKEGFIDSDGWFQMVWAERFEAVGARAKGFFDEADADADNVLTLEEYMAHGDDSDKTRFDSWVASDATDRTKLPKEMLLGHANHEFRQAAQSSFNEADTDKDGKVSSDECAKVVFYEMQQKPSDLGFHIDL